MVWISITALVIAAILFMIGPVKNVDTYDREYHINFRFYSIFPLGLSLVGFFLAGTTIIDAGEVGVRVTFGQVSNQTLTEGFNVHNPFSQVIKISIRDELYTVGTNEGEAGAVVVRLRDDNTAPVEFTVRYALDPAKANEIYRTQGINFAEKLIIPTARSVMRDVMGDYRAEQVAESRRDIGLQVQQELRTQLEPEGMFVRAFELRNVDLPQSFDEAVERKLAAEQQAQAKEFELQSAQQDAEIKRELARGEADANSILAASLESGEYVLALRYIEALSSIWQSGNSTIFMPSDFNQDFLFNLGIAPDGSVRNTGPNP